MLDRPHGHAFYEIAKTASHKLTATMAADLREHGVAVIGLSPGWMRLERMNLPPDRAAMTESPEFVGRAAIALAVDPDIAAKSGQVLTVVELAREYGFTDVDGSVTSPFWIEHYQAPPAKRPRLVEPGPGV